MKRDILICGILGGVLIAVLRWTEYRFLVMEHSVEIYGGLIAGIFAALGIWLGVKLSGPREKIVVEQVLVPVTLASPAASWRFLSSSPRA